MLELRTTTDELLTLIGQLTVENGILRRQIAELQAQVNELAPKASDALAS